MRGMRNGTSFRTQDWDPSSLLYHMPNWAVRSPEGYREVISDVGMHADLVEYWIRISALLILPIAPHFSEHIWSTVLKEPVTVQKALWPTPATTPDRTILDAGLYMRGVIKNLRDAELSLLKKMNKGKQGQATYDPKRPRAVRIYVSTAFPEWQEACVQVVKDAYAPEHDKVDDAKVRELLTQRGLIKDKRAMPFVQAFKVCFVPNEHRRIADQSEYRNACSNSALKRRSTARFLSRRSRFSTKFCRT